MKYLLFILLFVITLYANTEFEGAYELYKENDFKTALPLFEKLALEENDYDAAYILGYMYEHGEGCEKDLEISQKWYKKASKGYYYQSKPDPSRDIDKETRKLFSSIQKPLDAQTQATIKQYAESLYSIKAYHANYFLPASYRFEGEYPPTYEHDSKNLEMEFQFSIRYDFYANLLGLSEVYTFAYTQKSFWQLYAPSAFFRETNYNPAMFVTIPVGHIHKFDYLKAVRFSFEHQSNGRGGEQERSWNSIIGTFYVQTGFLFTELKIWTDSLDSLKYNKDLMQYLGYGQVQFILPYKEHLIKLLFRNSFSKYRATEINYSYPVTNDKNLFLYIKGFSGYGESLIDYNHKINKIGIGFSISR